MVVWCTSMNCTSSCALARSHQHSECVLVGPAHILGHSIAAVPTTFGPMDLLEAAKGTSLEAFLKMADASDDDVAAVEEDDDTKIPEFEDDAGTGETYTPFGSVYGAASSEVKAVLEAAAGAPSSIPLIDAVSEEAAAAEPSSPAAAGFAKGQKSNTTRCVDCLLMRAVLGFMYAAVPV
jgi:hypothetical protein